MSFNKKVIGIIPVRMGSSRFPGKPMAKIHDMLMIGHCYLRTRICPDIFDTYVATCDKQIYDYIKSIEGEVIMTSDSHTRVSDRAAEAMLKIEKIIGNTIDYGAWIHQSFRSAQHLSGPKI